jgi:large subunit ribosomal protein L6
MSRIGKQPITVPSGVEVKKTDGILSVKGPLGTLTRKFHSDIEIEINNNEINLKPARKSNFLAALWGTYASHIHNMIEGVTKGFEKKMIIEGVGYKVAVAGNTLTLDIGFSHPVKLEIPAGVKMEVTKNQMAVSGIDKEAVGGFAAKVRSHKKTEPYKGKGIRYVDEVVRRKQGKKSV